MYWIVSIPNFILISAKDSSGIPNTILQVTISGAIGSTLDYEYQGFYLFIYLCISNPNFIQYQTTLRKTPVV